MILINVDLPWLSFFFLRFFWCNLFDFRSFSKFIFSLILLVMFIDYFSSMKCKKRILLNFIVRFPLVTTFNVLFCRFSKPYMFVDLISISIWYLICFFLWSPLILSCVVFQVSSPWILKFCFSCNFNIYWCTTHFLWFF